MINYTFFDDAILQLFWQYVRSFLYMVAPGIMIVAAVYTVGYVVYMVIEAVKNDEHEDYYDEDEEF